MKKKRDFDWFDYLAVAIMIFSVIMIIYNLYNMVK